jgi:CBS domain-containing protein
MKKWLFVAVSLLVVALLMGGCGQSTGVKSPRELTEEERARVVEIALNTPQVSGWLEDEGEYQIAGLDWYAIDDGTWWCFEYEGIETDPNRQFVPESARWYPGVTIAVGEEWITQAQVAVDLETERAVLVEGPYPSLSSPGRFLKPAPEPMSIPPAREAVVLVKSQFKGERQDQRSGFITSSDGCILTFLSETTDLERLEVVLHDGQSFAARVVNTAPVTDLACIKIEATGLSTLKFGPAAALEVGQKLMLVGYSVGEFGVIHLEVVDPDFSLRLPMGKIPVVKVESAESSEGTLDVMEKLAGTAGGPVVNRMGEVVGVMLAVDPETGESFMVSVDYPGLVLVMRSCSGEINAYPDPEETISIRVDQEFAIGLPVDMRLGHKWVESHDNDRLTLVGESYIPDDVTRPSCGGIQYFRFKALEASITEIALSLKHSGTGPVIEEKVFKVEIK